jgi:hypothetical protein
LPFAGGGCLWAVSVEIAGGYHGDKAIVSHQ